MKKLKLKKQVAIFLSLLLGISLVIFITMLLFNVTDYGISIASVGATTFMVLSKKNLKKRKIYGAYAVATFLGVLLSNIEAVRSFNVALAAVSSVVIMTLLEFQHTPAIGISISMVLNKFNIQTDLVVLLSIFFIVGITLLLKTVMDDPKKLVNFIEIEEEKIKWNLRKKEINDYVKLNVKKS